MASRKPLVIISGQLQEIPAGDSISVAADEVDVLTRTNANAGSIVIGCPVYASVAGSVDKANASAIASSKCIGLVADTSIAAAASGNIQCDGILVATTGQWDAITGQTGGLTVNAMYYLDTTAGELTSTAPSASGNYVVRVGIALSTTELKIAIDLNSVLLA